MRKKYMLKIFTKNNCGQCQITKYHLKNIGVKIDEEVNVDHDEKYLEEARATGYSSMPIVLLDGKVIASGFQPDQLNKLI